MHPELEKLVHLQHLEQQALDLTARMDSRPKRLQKHETALADAERQLEETTRSIAAEERSRKSMELDVETLRRKAARYRAQLDTVQDPSQLKALEHEIGFAEEEVRRIEDAEIEGLVRTEALEDKQREQQAALAALRQQLADEKAAVQLDVERDNAELASLRQQQQSLRTTIDREMMALYDRTAASRKTAVAEAIGQRCSACQMVLRPQKWNELKNDVVLQCDSCGRLLYYNPPVDVLDAMTGPARNTQNKRHAPKALAEEEDGGTRRHAHPAQESGQ